MLADSTDRWPRNPRQRKAATVSLQIATRLTVAVSDVHRFTEQGYPCRSMEMLAKFHKRIKCGALLNPKTILHFFPFFLMNIKAKQQIRLIKNNNKGAAGPVQPVP
jgi:hypothetical protein